MLSKPKFKYIQSLGHKKFRDETGLFIAEGPKIVQDLISEIPQNIITVYGLEKWINENINLNGRVEVVTINEKELERISQLPTPNLVVAIVKKINNEPLPAKGAITIALDTIQDPGNLGTIIRIADWFGIKQIVADHESADMYNPKVVQATMGSIARVNVLYTDLKEWMKNQNVKIYATALAGKDISVLDKFSEGIIVIGNESKGISEEIMALAHEKITIPKKGKAESLNAAVATGIILSRLVE